MSHEFLSEQERTVVQAEQIRAFYSEANAQNIAGAAVMSLLVYMVHDGVPTWTWLPALGTLYLVTLARGWLFWQYRRTPGLRSAQQWGRPQDITGAASGICWGFANTAMLMHAPTMSQLAILTVITVSAASSASEGFSYLPPSRGYILGSIAPPTLWLLTVGDSLHTILGLMLLVFLPMTLWQAHKRNRIFIEVQQLRFRNEALAREVALQRDVAQQAYQAKARFLAAASHDLRQPMQALSIFHELLDGEPHSPRGAELLSNARQSADAMNMLLGALLDVSKLDANVIKTDCRPFPVQALLDEMAREFAPLASHKGLRLRIMPCSAVIRSDPTLLGQVLRNLLSNAIRYTPAGRVLMGCRRCRGQLRIEVFDTGIGIAEDQHAAIFAEFYQVDNKARDRKQGLGLGLAIVERVARLLGHPLALRSAPKRGSCFAVSVPLATPDDKVTAAPSDAESAPIEKYLRGRRVLLVDDEEAIRTGMGALLQGWGCEVITAGSVTDALASTRHATLDAVISDMGLPGTGNGIDAIAILRERHGTGLPALLVTGDTSQNTLQAAAEAGLIMLHKPIKPARLRAALTTAIAASSSRAAP